MDKRTDILQAALKLISEQGFHATPVSQIAEQAKVGAGTVYRYFKNKEDLLNQLYLEIKGQIHEAMDDGIRPEMPLEALFKRLWMNVFEFDVTHPQEFSFAEQYCDSPFLTDMTRTAGARVLQDHAAAFERGVREGVVQDLPAEMVFSIFAGSIASLAKKHLAGVLEMTEERRQQAAHATWCAVRR
jgi:AcrR family transcriptional regulator